MKYIFLFLFPLTSFASDGARAPVLGLSPAKIALRCEEGYRLSIDSTGSSTCVEMPLEYSRNYQPQCGEGEVRGLDKDGSLQCKPKKNISFFRQFLLGPLSGFITFAI